MLKKIGFLLIVFFLVAPFVMPLSLHAEMALCTDNELAAVSGRAGLATFQIEHRNTMYDDKIFPSNDVYFSHDVVVILLNMKISLVTDMRALMLGYYDGGWDIDLQNVGWGTEKGEPVVLDGLRLEVGFQDPGHRFVTGDPNDVYDHMASANRKFIFFKLGTDHFTGRLDVDLGNDVSIDARIVAHILIPITINVNQHRADLVALIGGLIDNLRMDDTDFFLAISQTGLDKCPAPVDHTFEAIPGNGMWLHFSDLDAYLGG